MSNASKNKGKAFEREFAKHLTSIFGLNFNRVPNSGAFTGGLNSFRNNYLTEEQKLLATGDIIVPKELGRYAFECKWYKDFEWHHVLTQNLTLDKWIAQASATSKQWFLIFKINRQGWFVVYSDVNASLYKHVGNKILYGKNIIVSGDQFFELNKETLLLPMVDLEPVKSDVNITLTCSK